MQWLIDIIIATICPPGMIMLWHGSIATIPSAWTLCNGTNGTPDLSGEFVRGAGPGFTPGISAGWVTHSHDFTGDGHAHELPVGTDIAAGADFDKDTSTIPAVGTVDSEVHLPPYYQLCYIMKL